MSEPFLAEVRMFGFNYAPRGWALCDGQILPINQNQSLYSLLGTTYGGDGRTSFGLPDMRGRTPIHVGASAGGSDHSLGSKSGEEAHSLAMTKMPAHAHVAQASADAGSSPVATGNVLAESTNQVYTDPANLVDMDSDELTNTGGGQAHNNMQPYLTVNFGIAITGLFPSRN
jgi:microcystin-dependent protein